MLVIYSIRVRATLESSSKKESFDRISTCQESWKLETGDGKLKERVYIGSQIVRSFVILNKLKERVFNGDFDYGSH